MRSKLFYADYTLVASWKPYISYYNSSLPLCFVLCKDYSSLNFLRCWIYLIIINSLYNTKYPIYRKATLHLVKTFLRIQNYTETIYILLLLVLAHWIEESNKINSSIWIRPKQIKMVNSPLADSILIKRLVNYIN